MRGRKAEIGDTRWSANGYHYTRTEGGWELTHRLLCERDLKRSLRSNERVRFRDGDKRNLDISNLEVRTVGESTRAASRARLESKIEDLQAQLGEVNAAGDT